MSGGQEWLSGGLVERLEMEVQGCLGFGSRSEDPILKQEYFEVFISNRTPGPALRCHPECLPKLPASALLRMGTSYIQIRQNAGEPLPLSSTVYCVL